VTSGNGRDVPRRREPGVVVQCGSQSRSASTVPDLLAAGGAAPPPTRRPLMLPFCAPCPPSTGGASANGEHRMAWGAAAPVFAGGAFGPTPDPTASSVRASCPVRGRARDIRGEPGDPATLSGCLDGARPVVAAGPRNRVLDRMAGQYCHARDHGARPSGAPCADHLDTLTGSSETVAVADQGGGLLVVAWSAKVRPVDPSRGPWGWWGRRATEDSSARAVRWSAEVQPELRMRSGR